MPDEAPLFIVNDEEKFDAVQEIIVTSFISYGRVSKGNALYKYCAEALSPVSPRLVHRLAGGDVPGDILERADKAVHRAPERLEYRLAYNPPEIGVPARDRHRNCGDKGDNYRDGGHYYSLFRDKVLQWSALRN